MTGRRVVIRTFDLGGDKNIPGMSGAKEENPALGCRAIRLCLAKPQLFKIQLRALCRASVYGNLSIIFPMVVCTEEVRRAKALLHEAMDELRAQGIPFNENLPVGLMLETPAAMMISDILAQEADFFSIGTNDLTQYALAADRHNPAVNDIYDAQHPAVIRMIKLAVSALHRVGKPVNLCGELAADTELTATFLALGVDGLSVPPDMILPVRQAIRNTNVDQIRPEVVKKYCVNSCLPNPL